MIFKKTQKQCTTETKKKSWKAGAPFTLRSAVSMSWLQPPTTRCPVWPTTPGCYDPGFKICSDDSSNTYLLYVSMRNNELYVVQSGNIIVLSTNNLNLIADYLCNLISGESCNKIIMKTNYLIPNESIPTSDGDRYTCFLKHLKYMYMIKDAQIDDTNAETFQNISANIYAQLYDQ